MIDKLRDISPKSYRPPEVVGSRLDWDADPGYMLPKTSGHGNKERRSSTKAPRLKDSEEI